MTTLPAGTVSFLSMMPPNERRRDIMNQTFMIVSRLLFYVFPEPVLANDRRFGQKVVGAKRKRFETHLSKAFSGSPSICAVGNAFLSASFQGPSRACLGKSQPFRALQVS
jgi:hypothetical protein